MPPDYSSWPGPGRPFTLWLDPSRWPAAPFRLPGAGFTLWQSPERWPGRTPQQSPPARVPSVEPGFPSTGRMRLPGAGFTLWTDPGMWPQPESGPWVPDAEVLPEPVPGGLADGLAEFPDGIGLQTEEEDGSPVQLGSFTTVPELALPAEMPMILPWNKAFTLWTHPGQVAPIVMKNGLTAAQVAAPPMAPELPVPAELPQRTVPVSGGSAERWLPLAAGVVAVLGVHALHLITSARQAPPTTLPLPGGGSPAAVQIPVLSAVPLPEPETEQNDARERLLQLEEENQVLRGWKEKANNDLAAAMEAVRKAGDQAASRTAVIGQLTRDLEAAKTLAATAGAKGEAAAVAATEEASRVKREATGEVVRLREDLARIEAEKAATIKALTESEAALAAARRKEP